MDSGWGDEWIASYLYECVQRIHASRSNKQRDALCQLVEAEWQSVAVKEKCSQLRAFADTFAGTYFQEPFNNFHVGFSSISLPWHALLPRLLCSTLHSSSSGLHFALCAPLCTLPDGSLLALADVPGENPCTNAVESHFSELQENICLPNYQSTEDLVSTGGFVSVSALHNPVPSQQLVGCSLIVGVQGCQI